MKEQRNKESRVFLQGGGGGSRAAIAGLEARPFSNCLPRGRASPMRAATNPRLPSSEAGAAGGAPGTPSDGAVRAPPRRRLPRNGAVWEEEEDDARLRGSAPSLRARRNARRPSAGKAGGKRRERGQENHGGARGGEQEKQDDRTLAPQPSAKLQTGLLRWKAAAS